MKPHWVTALFKSSAPPKLVIVVAHPDDEVIGCGGQLRRWRDAHLIHITDGSPRNPTDAAAAGFPSRKDYTASRRQETLQMAKLSGISVSHIHSLHLSDHETVLHLVEITEALVQRFVELQPEFVVTHPYEGGHPDHDSAALAVHLARRILLKVQHHAPMIVEAASYFNRAGIMATGEFLPRARSEIHTAPLTLEQRDFKRQLFDCYRTQQHVLQYFPITLERFRQAPEYDFAAPPHPGKLYYELFQWGTTGERWRKLASAAWRRLCPGAEAAAPLQPPHPVSRQEPV